MACENAIGHYTGIPAALHNDILWEIFRLNVDIFSTETSLEATLRSSQVCRAWRSCILASPSIWGRLLDLEALNQKTDNWKEEVLRRSGNSPLWIKGTIARTSWDPKPKRNFFFSVVDAHWERIQHVRLTIIDGSGEDREWRFLQRPSPYLQSFILYYPSKSIYVPLFSASPIPLFDNNAPSLRYLGIQHMFINLDPPWFSHLRRLEVSVRFTAFEMLNSLRPMQLLETLRIVNLSVQPDTHPGPVLTVNLPMLRDLRLVSRRHLCVYFLQHMVPADGCTLFCSADVGSSIKNALKIASEPLSRITQRYLCTLDVKEVKFFMSRRTYLFECRNHQGRRAFVIHISHFTVDSFDSFPSLLSDCDFSLVSRMYFQLSSGTNIFATSCLPFFSALSSLVELHVDGEHSLRTFLAPVGTPPVFPILHTLRVSSFVHLEVLKLPSPDGVGAISTFLRQRRDSGSSIRTLILWMPKEETRDIATLDEFPGLRIHWLYF